MWTLAAFDCINYTVWKAFLFAPSSPSALRLTLHYLRAIGGYRQHFTCDEFAQFSETFLPADSGIFVWKTAQQMLSGIEDLVVQETAREDMATVFVESYIESSSGSTTISSLAVKGKDLRAPGGPSDCSTSRRCPLLDHHSLYNLPRRTRLDLTSITLA